ncbi:MAG: DUF3137 domain-containing protein [Patescibacteria group bacterium]
MPQTISNNIIFTEKEPYEKGFSVIFDQYIKPKLQSLEEKRVELEKKYTQRKIISIPVIAGITGVFGVLLALGILPIDRLPVFLYILAITGVLWWMRGPVREYTRLAKENIIPEVLRFFGDFVYSVDDGIEPQILQQSRIMPTYDHYDHEDYLKGTYKNVFIEMNEANLRVKRGKHTSTVFKGQLIHFVLNKKFTGQTIVTTDSGKLGNFLGSLFSGMKKVGLEDPKFEAMFEVRGTDQIEARYLLTTAFMERLINLSELYQNHKIQCSFFDNTLFISIPSTLNLFEPGPIGVSVYDTDSIHTFLKQMHYVFDIANQLKLTSTTGL